MAKPTTIRIPEDLLEQIDRFAKEANMDRSVYLRNLVQKGFRADQEDRLLAKYARGELSQSELCRELNWSPWKFLSQLKERNLHLNVVLEDWLDSEDLPTD